MFVVRDEIIHDNHVFLENDKEEENDGDEKKTKILLSLQKLH